MYTLTRSHETMKFKILITLSVFFLASSLLAANDAPAVQAELVQLDNPGLDMFAFVVRGPCAVSAHSEQSIGG